MSYALALLQNTDTSILTTATSVGYESPSRFAERLRVRFGFVPSELRGHCRGLKRPPRGGQTVVGDIAKGRLHPQVVSERTL